MIISEIHTWYFKSKGLATGLGKKCFGKSRGEPERMFPHRPKVPLKDQDFNSDLILTLPSSVPFLFHALESDRIAVCSQKLMALITLTITIMIAIIKMITTIKRNLDKIV